MPSSIAISAKVFAVILAFNHIEDTRECLQSFISATQGINIELLLVDNGSSDFTQEIVQKEFPQVNVLRSDKNLGVAGGYNLGIVYSHKMGADFILIANNDISIDREMIKQLVSFMEGMPSAGIAMPKIFHYYGDRSRLWTIGAYWRKFPPSVKMMEYNRLDIGKYKEPVHIEYAPSCCYLIRGKVVDQIGGFDPEYFFYFDDWDYCVRVRNCGYTIWMVPTAQMWHKVSVSTQKSDRPFTWWKYMGQSAFRFYTKYHTKLEFILFIIWFFIREIIKIKPLRSLGFISGVWNEYNRNS